MKKNKSQVPIPNSQVKVFLLAACCLLLATLVLGCVKTRVKNIDSKGKNIVCFGDSITAGHGAEREQAYPFLISRMVVFPVVNSGIDGDTSREALKRIEPNVLSREPLLVIIEFGGNDFLTKIPLDETIKNLEVMIKKMQAEGAMVAVVDVSSGIVMDSYRNEFKRLSRRHSAIFVPRILDGILTDPLLKSDYIHPNAEGYKIVAQRVYQAIIPYLNENLFLRNDAR